MTMCAMALCTTVALQVACAGKESPNQPAVSIIGTHELRSVSGTSVPFTYQPDSALDGSGNLVVSTNRLTRGVVILEAGGRAIVESGESIDVYRAVDGSTTQSTLDLRDVGRWTDLGSVVQISVDSIYQNGASLGVGDLLLFQHSGASVKRHVSYLRSAMNGSRTTVNLDLEYARR